MRADDIMRAVDRRRKALTIEVHVADLPDLLNLVRDGYKLRNLDIDIELVNPKTSRSVMASTPDIWENKGEDTVVGSFFAPTNAPLRITPGWKAQFIFKKCRLPLSPEVSITITNKRDKGSFWAMTDEEYGVFHTYFTGMSMYPESGRVIEVARLPKEDNSDGFEVLIEGSAIPSRQYDITALPGVNSVNVKREGFTLTVCGSCQLAMSMAVAIHNGYLVLRKAGDVEFNPMEERLDMPLLPVITSLTKTKEDDWEVLPIEVTPDSTDHAFKKKGTQDLLIVSVAQGNYTFCLNGRDLWEGTAAEWLDNQPEPVSQETPAEDPMERYWFDVVCMATRRKDWRPDTEPSEEPGVIWWFFDTSGHNLTVRLTVRDGKVLGVLSRSSGDEVVLDNVSTTEVHEMLEEYRKADATHPAMRSMKQWLLMEGAAPLDGMGNADWHGRLHRAVDLALQYGAPIHSELAEAVHYTPDYMTSKNYQTEGDLWKRQK